MENSTWFKKRSPTLSVIAIKLFKVSKICIRKWLHWRAETLYSVKCPSATRSRTTRTSESSKTENFTDLRKTWICSERKSWPRGTRETRCGTRLSRSTNRLHGEKLELRRFGGEQHIRLSWHCTEDTCHNGEFRLTRYEQCWVGHTFQVIRDYSQAFSFAS
jgi:hypothetical protein